MKKIILCLCLGLFTFFSGQSQNVIELTNGSGISLEDGQISSLEIMASNALPAFSDSNFKIIDASFYTYNDEMGSGREEAIWEKYKTDAKAVSPNYLLMGRQYFEDKGGFKLWIHLEVDIEDLECYDVDFKNDITAYILNSQQDLVDWYEELTFGPETNTFEIQNQVAELCHFKLNKVCCEAFDSRNSCDVDDLDPQDLKNERDLKFYILSQIQCKLFAGGNNCSSYVIEADDPLALLTAENFVESSTSKFYSDKDKLPYFDLIHIYLSDNPNGIISCDAVGETGPDKKRWVVSEYMDIDDYQIPVVEYNLGQFTIVMPENHDLYATIQSVSEQVDPNLSEVLEDIEENGGHLTTLQLGLLNYTSECNFLNIADEAKKYTLIKFIVELKLNPFIKIMKKYMDKYPVFILQLYENIGYDPNTGSIDKKAFFEYQNANVGFASDLLSYEFDSAVKLSFLSQYIQDYLTSYVEIEEGEPMCVHVNGVASDNIMYLPYTVNKFMTFNKRNYFFKLNPDENKISIEVANVLTADFDEIGELKPFEPVVISSINVQSFGVINGLLPAIVLPVVDEFLSDENEFNAAMAGVDIVTTISVVGNLGKLRYLRKFGKAKFYFTGIEISATLGNNLIKYTELIPDENRRKRISLWLSLVEIGSAIGNGFSPADFKKIQDEGNDIARLLDEDPLVDPRLAAGMRYLAGGKANLLGRLENIFGSAYESKNLYIFVNGLDEVNDATKISRLSALEEHALIQVSNQITETAKIVKFTDDLIDPDKGLGLVLYFNSSFSGIRSWEALVSSASMRNVISNLEKVSEQISKHAAKLDDFKLKFAAATNVGKQNLLDKVDVFFGFKPGKFSEDIVAIPKGNRPHPSSYLTSSFISEHSAKFNNQGGAFLVVKPWIEGGNYNNFPPKKFAMLREDMQKAIDDYNLSGDVSTLENALGYNTGDLVGLQDELYVFYPNSSQYKFKIPEGNEIGANNLWEAGGVTSGNKKEAIMEGLTDPNQVIVHNKDINHLISQFNYEKL